MVVQNESWRIHFLSIQGCYDGGMEFVVVEEFTFPNIWTNNECSFRHLGMWDLMRCQNSNM